MTEQQIVENDLWQEFESEMQRAVTIQNVPIDLSAVDDTKLSQFWNIFLTEKLPEGDLNTTLEKNFAIYILAKKIDIEQIKVKYAVQRWNVAPLLGWVKKVNAGEIQNFNVGELVNWCKANRPDLCKLFQNQEYLPEDILRRNDLIFATSHLKYYSHVDVVSQILGKEYIHIKKLALLHFISSALPTSLKIVKYNGLEVDLRDFLYIVYPTGAAKGNINNLITLLKSIDLKVIPLMSMHEEQLIGRVIKRKQKGSDGKMHETFIVNQGHFASDELIFDECKPLLLDRDKDVSRSYCLKAMDKWGYNEIYKRMTENLDNVEETLSYFPHFNAVFCTQPFNFPEENIVLNGFMKRVSCDYLPPLQRGEEIFHSRLKGKVDFQNIKKDLVDFLFRIKNLRVGDWTFSSDFEETFKRAFSILRSVGQNNTRKKQNYTRLVEFTLQDRLLKKAALIALAKDVSVYVTGEHVELALFDCMENFVVELDYVNDKVFGSLDYGSVWGTTNRKEQDLLKYLYEQGAVSEETSSISIKVFQQEIINVFKIREEAARKIYYKLLTNEFIKVRSQVSTDQPDTRVWLLKIPDISHTGVVKVVSPKDEYLKLACRLHNVDLTEGGKGGKPLEPKDSQRGVQHE